MQQIIEFLNTSKLTSDCQCLYQKIILVNKCSERIKGFLIKRMIISNYLIEKENTLPSTFRVGFNLLDKRDSKVVFPAPEGPTSTTPILCLVFS